MNTEKCEAMYLDESLIHQPETIYRLKKGSKRFYYTFNDRFDPTFYVSVTTMIKQTMPTSPYLIKWVADMGHEEATKYAELRAHYGTFMHIEISEMLINQEYDLEQTSERLKAYLLEHKLPLSHITEWVDELKKDILAFAQFVIDYEVTPVAIEIMLKSDVWGYAGAIDLVCDMTIEEIGDFGEVYKTGKNKGLPKKTKGSKRVRAIIDLKSGRKGFYEEHAIQLCAYNEMWSENFPDYPVQKLYNWAPNEWVKSPSYKLKDQTNCKNGAKLPNLIDLAIHDNGNISDSNIMSFSGKIDLKAGINKNYRYVSMSAAVKKAREAEELRKEKEAEKSEFDEIMKNKS